MSYPLVRLPAGTRLDVDAVARAGGLHPETVRRWVALGLLEPETDAAGEHWFTPGDLAEIARIRRLRSGLGLNYAAVGVVVALLDHIAELEAHLPADARSARIRSVLIRRLGE